MAYGSWSSYYTKTVWNSSSASAGTPYSIDVKYRYRQDIVNNKSQIEGTSVTLRENISGWGISGSTFKASLGGSKSSYSDGSTTVVGYAPSSNTVTLNKQWEISHSSSGTATATIYWRGWSDNSADTYFQRSNTWSSFSITLPTIDVATPTISITSKALTSTYNYKVIAKSTVGSSSVTCSTWQYKLNSGSWTKFNTSTTSAATANITLPSQGTHTVQIRGTRSANNKTGYSSTISVNNVLPTITAKVDSLSSTYVKISATANVDCDKWEYSTNGGSTYTTTKTTGTSFSVGLTVSKNTTYKIIVRARRTSNSLYGSSTLSVTTPSNSAINSISSYYADSTSTSAVNLSWTVYDASYTHKFVLSNASGSTITQWTDIKSSVGKSNLSLPTTAAVRNSILNTISSTSTSQKLTLTLYTYEGSSLVGESVSVTLTAYTSASSSPTISGTNLADTNTTTLGLTGDSSVLVKNRSTATISFTAKSLNNATLSSITINGTEVLTSKGLSEYSVNKSYTNASTGTYEIRITDSRGYSRVGTLLARQVIAYITPTLSANIERYLPVNENKVLLSFSGACYNGSFGAVTNVLKIEYSYVDSSGSTTSVVIDQAASSTKYNYNVSNNSYYSLDADSQEQGSLLLSTLFDYQNAYEVTVKVSDKLSETSTKLTLIKGLPVFDFGSDDFNFNVDVTAPDVYIANVTDSSTGNATSLADFITKGLEYILTDTEYDTLMS